MVPSNENVTEGIMPNKNMSIHERYKYLAIQYDRYLVSGRRARGSLLDEMEAVTGLNRKTLVRHMRRRPKRQRRGRQRGLSYGAEVQDTIHLIAKALNYPCAERLKPMLPTMMDHLARLEYLYPGSGLRKQLERISVSTVARIRKRRTQDEPRLQRRRASPFKSAVQAQIPIRRIPWDIAEAGHFEVDLVHHSGSNASGEFIYTLQMVDVATGWVESAAILGRSFRVTRDGFLRCLARLPYPVREIHSDNGSEFMSHHLLRFWHKHYPDVDLSRIRPYRKQDNRFVEHRNGATTRALLGRERLDTVEKTILLNQIYDSLHVYFNLFQPVMRQTSKIYTQGRVIRKHEDVRTPFQRVCAMGIMVESTQRELEDLFWATDPFVLRDEINQLIHRLFKLPCAQPGHTEDIFDTLAYPELT
jgi:hypothetical protein